MRNSFNVIDGVIVGVDFGSRPEDSEWNPIVDTVLGIQHELSLSARVRRVSEHEKSLKQKRYNKG